MNDPDEVQLGKLAKRMLAMPPKKRENSKFGNPRAKTNKSAMRAVETVERLVIRHLDGTHTVHEICY
jgi:hypothetical protein